MRTQRNGCLQQLYIDFDIGFASRLYPLCHTLTLEILIILYVWLGQGVTRVGNSMFSVSLFLAECGSQSEAAVYRCL